MTEKPWENEPDYYFWTDESTGLRCAVIRVASHGALCGYVRLPHGHKYTKRRSYALGKLYGRFNRHRGNGVHNIIVHGGVTFHGNLNRPNGGKMRGKWIGFDCAHYMDYCPGFEKYAVVQIRSLHEANGTYRTFEYVKTEVESMAKQIARGV